MEIDLYFRLNAESPVEGPIAGFLNGKNASVTDAAYVQQYLGSSGWLGEVAPAGGPFEDGYRYVARGAALAA